MVSGYSEMCVDKIVLPLPTFIRKARKTKMRKMETLNQFLKSTLEESQKELEEIRKLQQILDQLSESEGPRVYKISVSSNL